MNKTLTVNLANIVFNIDEGAYSKLKAYLDSIKKYYSSTDDSEEILKDVENRIAEIFLSKLNNAKEVVTDSDIDSIIELMGRPEEFEDENVESSEETKKSKKKRLYRDTDDRILGGIASGFSHYFGIEPMWMRIIFIALLLFGVSAIIYIILWIVVPKAQTTSEKLEMRGKKVNLGNITDSISKGFEDLKKNENLKDISDTTGNVLSSLIDLIKTVIVYAFKAIRVFVGIILLVVSSSILLGGVVFLFSLIFGIFMEVAWIHYMAAHFPPNIPVSLIFLIGLIISFIPAFFLFYLGLKLVLPSTRFMNRTVGLSLLGLWIITIILGLTYGFSNINRNYDYTTNSEEVGLELNEENKSIKILMSDSKHGKSSRYRFNKKVVFEDGSSKKLKQSKIYLDIKTSEIDSAYMVISKRGFGNTTEDAEMNAINMKYKYNWDSNSNILKLDSYFLTDFQFKFGNRSIDVDLYLPEGSKIKLDRSVKNFLNNVYNEQQIDDSKMTKYEWIMTKEGLSCIDCKDKIKRFQLEASKSEDSVKMELKIQ